MMIKRVSFHELIELVEDQLPAERAAAVRQIAATSEEMQAMLTWVEQFYAVQREYTFSAPPARVKDPAKQLFRQRYGHKKVAKPTLWQSIQAALTFDSWADAHLGLAGARAVDGASLPSRQLLFTTEPLDLALDLRANDQGTNLSGQILPRDETLPEMYSVQLLANDQAVGLVTANDFGEFQFGNVATGSYTLIVSNPLFEVTLSTLDVS